MKIHEITEGIDSDFVNDTIANDSKWAKKGQGLTASVWQHMDDPHTVVKVIGGGQMNTYEGANNAGVAFVKFCKDNSNASPHLPKILDINTKDPEVVQIRMEKLNKIPDRLARLLTRIVSVIDYVEECGWDIKQLETELIELNIDHVNSTNSIIHAIKLLAAGAVKYANLFDVPTILLDLHADNWMLRNDGTVVAVDPWHGRN